MLTVTVIRITAMATVTPLTAMATDTPRPMPVTAMAIRLMVMGPAITAVRDTPIPLLSAAISTPGLGVSGVTGATKRADQSIVFVVTTLAPAMMPSGATVSLKNWS